MNTSQNQFNIGIDGTYQTIEMPRSAIIGTGERQRREGACLLRGR